MDDAVHRDEAARGDALDPTRSFIVQAPAGSGKTGLLIQRFLALLASVDEPEAIVAMTFTRKAAGEILERVIEALRGASEATPLVEPHKALTWRLARRVVERDAVRGWNLLAHPARLRIVTIDALCGALMRRAPLAAKLGALPRFVERADTLYRRAAREELAAAAADDAPWKTLIARLDNNADLAVGLLADMLARREQWLPNLVGRDPRTLRPALEEALRGEIERALRAVTALLPKDCIGPLLEHARHAAENLVARAPQHPMAAWLDALALPAPTADRLPQWRALAGWLLTKAGGLLKDVNVAHGFPPKGSGSDPAAMERAARKHSMLSLLDTLGAVPGFAEAVDALRRLPPPRYGESDWAFLESLLDVLPRTAARLRLVFAGEGVIDFTEATLTALDALDPGAPSDLLLALDTRIAHLLVDEFQDTSTTQCRLIRSLTAGWEVGDGRTLFLVGDPMQSIYGFREADVEAFLDAQRDRRLGDVALEPLTLACNFRSRPALVEWVNRVFPQVLPAEDGATRRNVAFKGAAPVREARPNVVPTLELFADAKEEARAVVARVSAALNDPNASVAVLVRKRGDLRDILPALRESGIPFKAVGLDPLSDRPALLDLLSLTHALLQPGDRLAWLSVLRAPWCGLTLPDLFALVADHRSFPNLFTDPHAIETVAGISSDGRVRLARFAEAMAPALRRRARTTVPRWVRSAWLALGGPACMAESIDRVAADRYFALLATYAKGGDVPEWRGLVEAMATIFVEPDTRDTARVQVMTLHRAKGLEFDVVIMPGLARSPRSQEEQLLLWRERPWLVAPVTERAPDAGKDPLYAYVSALAKADEAAELGRLLYVGCTRARERLHITACLGIDDADPSQLRWKQPAKGTALAALWPAIANDAAAPIVRPGGAPLTRTGLALYRLPAEWRLPPPPAGIEARHDVEVDAGREVIAFDWARESARQIGIAAHRLLRQVAEDGLERWDRSRIVALHPRVDREFGRLGFDARQAKDCADLVIEGVAATLTDDRGRWLFDPNHREARSEWALTGERDGALVHVVLDRTFLDDRGIRWIVDFKLSRHEGADRETFLDGERERYRSQLEAYAHVMRGMEERPLRLGLYFPLLRGWREWDVPA